MAIGYGCAPDSGPRFFSTWRVEVYRPGHCRAGARRALHRRGGFFTRGLTASTKKWLVLRRKWTLNIFGGLVTKDLKQFGSKHINPAADGLLFFCTIESRHKSPCWFYDSLLEKGVVPMFALQGLFICVCTLFRFPFWGVLKGKPNGHLPILFAFLQFDTRTLTGVWAPWPC